jgi:hypothetical protein
MPKCTFQVAFYTHCLALDKQESSAELQARPTGQFFLIKATQAFLTKATEVCIKTSSAMAAAAGTNASIHDNMLPNAPNAVLENRW